MLIWRSETWVVTKMLNFSNMHHPSMFFPVSSVVFTSETEINPKNGKLDNVGTQSGNIIKAGGTIIVLYLAGRTVS